MARALLSVTDKAGVVDFARGLADRGFELISTGGTAKALREGGLTVTDVSEITGFPEMLDGRVKTLHPMVHGGLLGDTRLESHRQQMGEAGIQPIDILCVNLYAFEKTVTGDHTLEEAIESIDIGGPAMIRAAAKNHANLTVIVSPADYEEVLTAIDLDKLADFRLPLAAKAFRHTAYYDSMISRYLTRVGGESPFTDELTIGYHKRQRFRYGENPHQAGVLYVDPLAGAGIANATQIWGKELSYNNVNDANGAWELVCDLPAGACAIIKHTTPCGAAIGKDLAESFRMARDADPISAFGGIAAFNQPIDVATAEAMTEKGNYLEVIIAPAISDAAAKIFENRSGWGQDVRLLVAPLVAPAIPARAVVRSIGGGVIVQEEDQDPNSDWKVVTESQPTPDEMAALRFLWAIIPHVKSNAIVVGREGRLLGVGAGQMNRVQSVRLALEQAGDLAKGAVLASDAFFPFPDSIHTAAEAGIRAIVQPGGSKKDPDVIAAANERTISMVFTGVRHFLH